MQKGGIVDHSERPAGTESRNSIPPGARVGLLGGGQLGRMFALEARRLGYCVHVFDPQPHSPAGQIGDIEVSAGFDDIEALERFADGVDVVTYEFENIPIEAARRVAGRVPVRPRGEVLHVCQNREREKRFLAESGIPCAPFRVVRSAAELERALAEVGAPAMLKTADFGYDGKGQVKIDGGEDAEAIWRKFGAPAGVLEKWISFERELSVVCARGLDGSMATFPVSENIHRRNILDVSIVPARIPEPIQERAAGIVREIAERLEVTGLITAEFFLAGGELLVNELAPRPHNSGHYSFDACVTSQFEQQLRAVCGLPLGAPDLFRPVVMVNLLGDLWAGGEPDWAELLADPLVKLHLYGKSEARPGRKMGHYCVFGDSADEALERARHLQAKFLPMPA